MAEVIPFEDPENYRRVHQRIKKLWEAGEVEFWVHAQQRMGQDGIDANDGQHTIRYGRIVEHSHPGQRWRYAIDGMSVDRDKIRVVVEINESLAIVTVVNPKKRKV